VRYPCPPPLLAREWHEPTRQTLTCRVEPPKAQHSLCHERNLCYVTISNKTRTILWGLARGRCAVYRTFLIREATETDEPSIIGEAAHIVSPAPTGPRAGYLPDHDVYGNLILLCAIDHKMVDDQVSHYTVEFLHQLKDAHEARYSNLETGVPVEFGHPIEATDDIIKESISLFPERANSVAVLRAWAAVEDGIIMLGKRYAAEDALKYRSIRTFKKRPMPSSARQIAGWLANTGELSGALTRFLYSLWDVQIGTRIGSIEPTTEVAAAYIDNARKAREIIDEIGGIPDEKAEEIARDNECDLAEITDLLSRAEEYARRHQADAAEIAGMHI
jgi:hypothetical protein